MVHSTSCQTCGEQVMAKYARVFENDKDELHACPNCSTQRALARGTGVDADRDGALLVHHPDKSEPVEALIETDRTEFGLTNRCQFEDRSAATVCPNENTQTCPPSTDDTFKTLISK